MTQPTFDFVVITPETAKEWLKFNTNNRFLSDTIISRYANDMINNRWAETADPIRFGESGKLLDGQHRLNAIIKANVPIKMLVVRGLEDSTQTRMDQGKLRSTGDQLHLSGIKNANYHAAWARLYLTWEGGYFFENSRNISSNLTRVAIQDWVISHKDLVDMANDMYQVCRNVETSPSVSAATYVRFAQIDPDEAKRLYSYLGEGGAPVHSPANILDQKLRKLRRDRTRITDREKVALFVQTWNLIRSGKTKVNNAHLSRPSGGWTINNFPEPK